MPAMLTLTMGVGWDGVCHARAISRSLTLGAQPLMPTTTPQSCQRGIIALQRSFLALAGATHVTSGALDAFLLSWPPVGATCTQFCSDVAPSSACQSFSIIGV